ncbi:MAG: hypothetical protein [Caudoviricetes sp.]|nr:MAG: hypothetical protein [Caudoviricetes sp.]
MIDLLRDKYPNFSDSTISYAVQEGLRKVATFSNIFNDYLDLDCCPKVILYPLKGKLLRIDEVFYLNGKHQTLINSGNYSISLGKQAVLNLYNINCFFKKIRLYYRYIPDYCDIELEELPFDTTPIMLFAESYLLGLDENRKNQSIQLEKEALYSLEVIKDNFNKRPVNIKLCV